MLRNTLLPRSLPRSYIKARAKSDTTLDIQKLEQQSAAPEVLHDASKERDEEIERKRNKSRLRLHDYNLVNDQPPHPEASMWFHGTLKYQRKMYGRYGAASGVDPSLCWPTRAELDNVKEYERVAHPFTIPQMMEAAREKAQQRRERVMQRQEELVAKAAKSGEWKQDLWDRIAKKENDARQAKEKKERLIDEVRRYFGYKVDPKDEKFKEMLVKKEKEQKKLLKEARRKEKEEKMISRLLNKHAESTGETGAADKTKSIES